QCTYAHPRDNTPNDEAERDVDSEHGSRRHALSACVGVCGPVRPPALPRMPLLCLHGCLHAFENHRILERHEVIERSLVKRVFAEESEHPPGADLLAARERDVLSWQTACLGDCEADAVEELALRLDR